MPILIYNQVSKDNFELFLDPKIKNFLPDPNIFIDMDKTVKRIANEIENKKIPLLGSGENILQFIHADDLSNYIYLSLTTN